MILYFQAVNVPITFNYAGKTLHGKFSHPHGAGSKFNFFLTIDNRHVGQLFYSTFGWQFYSNAHPDMTKLFSEYFGDYVVHWIDGTMPALATKFQRIVYI